MDLFEFPELLPNEVVNILEKWEDKMINGLHYKDCETIIDELNAIGYICDYGLDSVLFNLKKI